MRLNLRVVDESGETNHYSYDFEGCMEFYRSTGKFDKTNKLTYEGDIVEYRNNLYEVCLGNFETKDGFSCIGWHLRPQNGEGYCVPINEQIFNKIKVVDI